MGFDPITMGVVALGSAGISAVGALEEGQAAVQQVYPLPANILAIVAYTETGDDQ